MASQPPKRIGRSAGAARRRAVTLLEMLVALALMAMLASALYMSLHTGFRANARAESALVPARTAALALEWMRRDLESALPPVDVLAGPFLGEEGTLPVSDEPADTLSFFALVEDVRGGGPAIRKIEFALEASEGDEADIHLVRRETANLLAPTEPEPKTEILCRRVRAFELAYFGGTEWTENWDSANRGNVLPLAVEVRLVLRAEGGAGEEGTYELTRLFALPCARFVDDEEEGSVR